MSDGTVNVISTKPGLPRRKKIQLGRQLALYILMAPTILSLFIFNYIPMYGVIIAFQDYSVFKGVMGSDWVSLKHFTKFLTDDRFWSVMQNTLIINFYDLLFGFTAPILFALLANEIYNKKFKRIMQTVSYLPHFLSWVVVAGLFYAILSPSASGLVNNALVWLFGIEPIFFMTEPGLFRGIVVFADIWKSVGFSAILYFAVIAGIDSSLYEAAWIDGANRVQQAIFITLPGMAPMIVLMFLLKIASIFGIGFERIFLMQNPLVYDKSDVIATYVYRIGLEQAQYSLTTAIGLTQSLLAFVLLISANWASKRAVGMGLY
ncbi:ABC transporter permease [Paenibacillus eucommiae]|uniref:Aldouronate transport system permease protein n=1 Tax=Paenibacillus eucommiae TaxID=1355755 RepID=A0ABS4J1R2_9BACL|nr:ABC transporter permease subunit [Paenibacillus eucommiae]MBP1993788.1 putative aldouronate transport system permease protein [Paenibacillus eucommiae]